MSHTFGGVVPGGTRLRISSILAAAPAGWASAVVVIAGTIAVLLALGAAAARAASVTPVPADSGPTVGADPASHAQFVFWRGAGDIYESYYYTHWRGPIDVTSRFGLGSTNAAPSIAVAADDQQYLFWRGPDGTIREGHHTTRWTTYAFSAWGRATSAPAVAVDPRTHHQYVFWRGSDGYLHEAWYTNRWHCCQDFTSWGPAGSAPAVAVADDEQQYVFWRMPNGHVREAHHTSLWMPIATFAWQTTAAPAVGVDPVDNDQYVFWRDRTGKVAESWYSQHVHGWRLPHAMTSWPSAAGPPSVAVADDNQQYVFWQVPSRSVQEAHYTKTWHLYAFARWTPAPTGSSGSGASGTTRYCTATDLGIHLEKTRGAAGSQYRDFGFVDVGARSCRLYGYPGVSAVTSSGAVVDFQVERRTSEPERTVVLAPGAEASFSLATTDVTPGCKAIRALRFIPPGDRRYEQIKLRFQACGNRVTVSPVESQPPPI